MINRKILRKNIEERAADEARTNALYLHMSLNCWNNYVQGITSENIYCIGANESFNESHKCLHPSHDYRYKE